MKKVLITGGASGLGKEIVSIALKKGYSVDILDILPIQKDEFGDFQEFIHYISFDLSHVTTKKLQEVSGIYDICICNAGISVSGDFTNIDFQKERNVFEINTLGHIELIKHLLQNNCIKTGGCVAFTISATQILPFPIAVSYAASKGALHSFAHALRSYLIGKSISVSSIYPGPMPTEHVKYYNKEVLSSEKNKKKIIKIAQRVFSGIVKKKKHIYPDNVSRLVSLPIIRSMPFDKLMHKIYKKDFT